jgi:hypothetical protein
MELTKELTSDFLKLRVKVDGVKFEVYVSLSHSDFENEVNYQIKKLENKVKNYYIAQKMDFVIEIGVKHD